MSARLIFFWFCKHMKVVWAYFVHCIKISEKAHTYTCRNLCAAELWRNISAHRHVTLPLVFWWKQRDPPIDPLLEVIRTEAVKRGQMRQNTRCKLECAPSSTCDTRGVNRVKGMCNIFQLERPRDRHKHQTLISVWRARGKIHNHAWVVSVGLPQTIREHTLDQED